MDSLLNVYGIVACTIAAASVLALVVAAFLPKPRRAEIVRRVGRWWTGF
jgi:hypothetical protein